MKHICFSIANISRCGGTERMTCLIASELCRHGYMVSILSHWGDKNPYFECNPQVKIVRLQNEVENKFMQTHPKYDIYKARLWYMIHRPDIVVDVDLMMSNLTLPSIKGLGIKHIAWDHFSYSYFLSISHMQKALVKIKQQSDAMVVLTKKDLQLYIDNQEVNPDLIHQIYNPLTFDIPEPQEHNAKKVISLGRFDRLKGFDLLLKAWAIVEKSVDDWTLDIWGYNGLDTGDVFKTFDELKLSRASLNPATTDVQVKLSEASIYVLPSRSEGLGLVLIEASACSLPLIAFDCPNGPGEIIEEGANGMLVDAENVEQLAEKMIEMIKDPNKRNHMGKAAYKRAHNFDMPIIIEHWKELIEGI